MQATIEPSSQDRPSYEPRPVVITGMHIPFGDLVTIMLKICFASIPVVLVVSLVYALALLILGLIIAAP